MSRRRILLPMGLAAIGEAKLEQVVLFARALEADVVVVHVMPPGRLSADHLSAAEASARSFLDTVVAGLRGVGVHAEALVLAGRVAEVILAEAEQQQVLMIILGTTVRRWPASPLGASIAERVSREAACPVLLVPPGRATHEHHALWSFQEAIERTGAVSRRQVGQHAVQVVRIVGSVGRWQELGVDFRPPAWNRRKSEEHRFAAILEAMDRADSLPPIDLYKIGFGYYVLDGHRRVAAAQRLGQEYIDANVTEFQGSELEARPDAVGDIGWSERLGEGVLGAPAGAVRRHDQRRMQSSEVRAHSLDEWLVRRSVQVEAAEDAVHA